jgi:hypothetical protein
LKWIPKTEAAIAIDEEDLHVSIICSFVTFIYYKYMTS